MLIRGARVWPPDSHLATEAALAGIARTDVRLTSGMIAECGPGLRPEPGEEVVAAAGGVLLPGLHDHHVHLRALAAAAASVGAGPPQTRTSAELATRLRTADADLPPGAWLRAVGYHESVAGALDRDVLDRLLPRRPVRVQHRSGALWVVNSLAAAQLSLDRCELSGVERDSAGRPTGRLWRMDRWLASRVPGTPADLGAVSREAAALGITGFTDATPGATAHDLAALADAPIKQRLCCMAPPAVRPPKTITAGPVKIMLDDLTLPSLDELADQIRDGHAAGRPAAVHCVTRVQLVLTLAALDLAGRLPGDRIEHGAVIGSDSLPDLRGLTVVTQPHFVAERGEQYTADVAAEDLPDLWRLRSLIDAGVAVAAGSDAPFGSADPWGVMRAAVRRAAPFGPAESVSPGRALALFLGEPAAPAVQRLVAPGQPADLALLRAGPREMLGCLASDLVAATFIGGEIAYARLALARARRSRSPCQTTHDDSLPARRPRRASGVP
jgi:predicted amidohydrolase YtcJ